MSFERETAQAMFDVTLSSRQVEELGRDAGTEAREAGVTDVALQGCLEALVSGVRETASAIPGDGEPVGRARVVHVHVPPAAGGWADRREA